MTKPGTLTRPAYDDNENENSEAIQYNTIQYSSVTIADTPLRRWHIQLPRRTVLCRSTVTSDYR